MKLPQNASEDQVQCHVRAYILIMLANFVFLDTTGDSIPCVYLPMLQDLSRTSSYAWGAMLLARLYRNLCRGCKWDSKKYIEEREPFDLKCLRDYFE